MTKKFKALSIISLSLLFTSCGEDKISSMEDIEQITEKLEKEDPEKLKSFQEALVSLSLIHI